MKINFVTFTNVHIIFPQLYYYSIEIDEAAIRDVLYKKVVIVNTLYVILLLGMRDLCCLIVAYDHK